MGQFSQGCRGQAHLGAGELQRTRLTFLQQPLVKGLTPPRNLPVTCGTKECHCQPSQLLQDTPSGPGQRYFEIQLLFLVPDGVLRPTLRGLGLLNFTSWVPEVPAWLHPLTALP